MCTNTDHWDGAPADEPGDDARCDPATGTARSSFDEDADEVVVAVVETVATLTDRDLTAMPPLFGTVDPEALTDLVNSSRERSIEVSFSYEGCRVIVSSRGDVVVEPLDRSSS